MIFQTRRRETHRASWCWGWFRLAGLWLFYLNWNNIFSPFSILHATRPPRLSSSSSVLSWNWNFFLLLPFFCPTLCLSAYFMRLSRGLWVCKFNFDINRICGRFKSWSIDSFTIISHLELFCSSEWIIKQTMSTWRWMACEKEKEEWRKSSECRCRNLIKVEEENFITAIKLWKIFLSFYKSVALPSLTEWKSAEFHS